MWKEELGKSDCRQKIKGGASGLRRPNLICYNSGACPYTYENEISEAMGERVSKTERKEFFMYFQLSSNTSLPPRYTTTLLLEFFLS